MKYWKTKFVIYITHRFDDLKSVDVQGKSGVFSHQKIGPCLGRSPQLKDHSMICQILYFRSKIIKRELILEKANV